MAYEGQLVVIPLGQAGVMSDYPDTAVPANKLSRAINVTLNDNQIEKDFGSQARNANAFPAGVKCFMDWWPTPSQQRMVAVCMDGKTYRLHHPFAVPTEITPVETSDPALINVTKFVNMLACGNEELGNPRKIFILNGKDNIQVISGDGLTRTTISMPPADFSSPNNPFTGVVHRSRVILALGHRIYISSATDHEDFTSTSIQFSVYPGEGERIIQLFVYKSRLFILKEPFGLYMLEDSDPDLANWSISKINGDFGGTSPFGGTAVIDDFMIANNFGTITSVQATFALGDVKSADLYNILKVDKFIRENLSLQGGDNRHCLYYPDGKILYTTYKKAGSTGKSAFVQMNVKTQTPEVVITNKDLPNCLGLVKDVNGISRPHYGAPDGYIYRMDCKDRSVGEEGYRAEIWTQDMDFSSASALQSEQMKDFDFVEITYMPTGEFDLTVEVYVDGRLVKGETYSLGGEPNSTLDVQTIESEDVNLTAKTSAECPMSQRVDFQAQGRRISVRMYNENANENFKLLRLGIYYKVSAQQQVRK